MPLIIMSSILTSLLLFEDYYFNNIFSFAFAETKSKEEVAKAVKLMDSQEINGRRLRVRSSHAKEKKDQDASPKRLVY
jgi:RNA recognition motif-containing protein